MNFSFISIIIVNYNGAHYLPACLDALRDQSYPSDCFEVIVSDNGSTDNSLALLRSNYSWVRLLNNGCNLGFASGNNRAIKASQAEHVVLLNNDTIPSPAWLENLVKVVEDDKQAGMVTSRLQLLYDQLTLTLQTDTLTLPNDSRPLGLCVYGVDSQTPNGVVQYLDGFYGWEADSSGNRFRRIMAVAHLGVPVPRGTGDWRLKLSLASGGVSERVRVKVTVEGQLLGEWHISNEGPLEYSLVMPSATRSMAKPLVQNAGSYIFKNGSGRDRGTVVRNGEAFYETDDGQYNRIEEVFAGCGAGLLIRKTMLDDIGFLDDDFFMYYEDMDLSWRARLRGWKILYAPQAVVRHVHCGTSGEWSPLFLYHVERNRLAMLFKNGSWGQIGLEWGKYTAKVLQETLRMIFTVLRARKDWRIPVRRAFIQYRVLWALLKWLPGLWGKRHRIQKRRKVSQNQITAWYVNQE